MINPAADPFGISSSNDAFTGRCADGIFFEFGSFRLFRNQNGITAFQTAGEIISGIKNAIGVGEVRLNNKFSGFGFLSDDGDFQWGVEFFYKIVRLKSDVLSVPSDIIFLYCDLRIFSKLV